MFRFIDLFAGLGGFHVALKKLGGTGVFACELDERLRFLYQRNFGILPAGDIREVNAEGIPDHEVLCGGFPCQSFSKAGSQQGLQCQTNGDLIDYVYNIIKIKRPRIFMLENVPNLLKHANGATWSAIQEKLSVEYDIAFKVLSPHEFGIPQVRGRVFILGARRDKGGLGTFSFPEASLEKPDLRKILHHEPAAAKSLSANLIHVIDTWNVFVKSYPSAIDLPSFPIWAMEFGATYPIDGPPPLKRTLEEMRTYKGKFGQDLSAVSSIEDVRCLLPHHALVEEPFPTWKQAVIRQNRELYRSQQNWIDPWLPNIVGFTHSFQKLEWNCKGCERDLWKHILQVRASGIRAKRSTTAPSLIAMTTTQVPIIGWEKRYMTACECAALQSIESLEHWPSTQNQTYKALGNAVNAQIVSMVAGRILLATDLMNDSLTNSGPK